MSNTYRLQIRLKSERTKHPREYRIHCTPEELETILGPLKTEHKWFVFTDMDQKTRHLPADDLAEVTHYEEQV